MKRILLTGCSGFVGRAIHDALSHRENVDLVSVGRTLQLTLPATTFQLEIRGINRDTDWSVALGEVDTVIHAAARVHVMDDRAKDPLVEFRKVNVEGTLNLARQAAISGVRRFLFFSSVKVNGEQTMPGIPFTEQSIPQPNDPYAISKYEAEQALQHLSKETGMEVVIIRPPLVYGPGVKANFHNMMRWLLKNFPLPLGAIHNKRSLVGLDNLVDFTLLCIDHPDAANEIFLVADGEDLSTTELLGAVKRLIGSKTLLIPVPVLMLRLGARLLGKYDFAQRLCGSLQVDISKARILLGWAPPISVAEGLHRTTKPFVTLTSSHLVGSNTVGK